MAAGAVSFRIASASTVLEEPDPRPAGMTTTHPRTEAPAWGWRRSTITPVWGSSPPHRESGSARTTAGPWPDPGARVRPLDSGSVPEAFVTDDPSGDGRAHALVEAAERHLDADVRRPVY